MKFNVTLKDIAGTSVYSGPDKDFSVTSLNLTFEVEHEVRNYGIKGTAVIVTKCAIGLMDEETDEETTCEGYELEIEQPSNYASVYIDDIDVDMVDKTITVNFQ